MSRRFAAWWPLAGLLLLTAIIYVGSASAPALLDDIDAMYADIARAMNARGDWITPYANGFRYFEKPPLFYWLMSLSYAVFGEANEFTTRLPIALAIVALVGVTFDIGRRLFGLRAGLLGGLALATSIGTFVFTRGVLVDAALSLLVTLFFHAFVRWQQAASKSGPLVWMYLFTAMAVMVKGLIGIVFPALGVLAALLATGRARELRELISGHGIAIFLLVTVPWHVAAEWQNPGFLRYYIVNEHILRFLGTREPQDYGRVPLLQFWMLHLVWLFPWSFYLLTLAWPANLRRLCAAHGQTLVVPFAWAGSVLLFFSFSSSRIEYYTFPALPALALLAGAQCCMAWERNGTWAARLIAAMGIPAAVGLLAAVMTDSTVLADLLQQFDDDVDRIGHFSPFFEITADTVRELRVPLLLAAVALGVILPAHGRMPTGRAKASVLVGGSLMLFAAIDLALSIFSPHLTTKPLAGEINRLAGEGTVVVVHGDYESVSSVGFYTGLPVLVHRGRSPNLEYGAAYPDAGPLFLDDDGLRTRWADGAGRAFLITSEQKLDQLAGVLPSPGHFVARQGNKILLSNRDAPVETRQASLTASPGAPRRPAGLAISPRR